MRRLSQISARVFVATADLYVTNSTVLSDGDGGCLVIDPAVTAGEVAGLAADLRELSLRPRAGFATHPHWDHLLWSSELGDVPRYASALAAATAERERAGLIEGLQKSAPGHEIELFGRLTPLDRPGAIGWDGLNAVIVTHDGHAPGHSALFLPEDAILIAGDMCSDIEIPLLDLERPDPVDDYRAGLDRLADLPVRQVIPGHGTVGDAAEFRHRIELDRAYLASLTRAQDLRDPRPIADWLVAEHERQARWVSDHRLGE
jgi:glyoxylase-like metal-dependent hydrolase (beta-lactamase superfamily II)